MYLCAGVIWEISERRRSAGYLPFSKSCFMSFTSVEEPERRKIPGCSSPAREKTHVDQPNNPGDGIRLISGKRIYQRFCTQMFGKLPQNNISRNHKIANKRLLLSTEEPCRTCHYELKRRKALWLQAREALWSNCKRRSQAHRDFSCVRKMTAASLAAQQKKSQHEGHHVHNVGIYETHQI